MTGLSSHRVSITKAFLCVPLIICGLLLLAAPEPGNANEDPYKAQGWGSPAQASNASELQVGDLYAVVVGVSKYKDARIPALSVSDKDARSIAEFLKTQKNLFKDIHVSLFVNEHATKKALEKELFYGLKPAGKDDTVIVFLSGHGTDDPKNPGEFFFLPYDADSEFIAVGGIHMNRQWFVDKLDSKRVLIIADACHAGGFADSGVKRLPPSLDKFMSQFKESEGRVFITSSRADEYSKEKPELGHSLFTHFLLEGLAGKAADQDGVVSLKALYDYVYNKTRKASGGYQSPQKQGRIVGKFPVALVMADISPVPQVTSQKPAPTTNVASELESKARTGINNQNARQVHQEASTEFSKRREQALSSLKTDECVVIFDVSEGGVDVKVIRNKTISKAFYTKWNQKDLENAVRRFREPFEKVLLRDFDPELAKSFYHKLLLQALESVPKGAPIIIIPDGILAMLPFEALVTGGNAIWRRGERFHERYFPGTNDYPDGLTFLGDERPISYYHSIATLIDNRSRSSKNKPTERLLVIADPVFDYKDPRTRRAGKDYLQLVHAVEQPIEGFKPYRLHETGVLAENLQKMYGANCLALTGLKANKADFLSYVAPKIDQFGSIVFATHGDLGANLPGLQEPFLALTTMPPGTDGFLKRSEILSLKMNADIVALTSSQTGLGKGVSGEGVMSMGQAFQNAGAKSTLVTLWVPQVTSAVSLTENFFKHLKEGKTKLKALQAAREDIRNSGYKHPFFWAAFILVGEAS